MEPQFYAYVADPNFKVGSPYDVLPEKAFCPDCKTWFGAMGPPKRCATCLVVVTREGRDEKIAYRRWV